jgi:RHS repeat-associated protein
VPSRGRSIRILPGQYFDKETNLHYNVFRDYDPAIGRYVQSDPIGLTGGLNVYLYVAGDPIRRTDVLGLTGTIVAPRPIIVPWQGLSPRPFPIDPAIPFVPDRPGDDAQPRFCKLVPNGTENLGAAQGGRHKLRCTYECAGGGFFDIELDWKYPSCPDYWSEMASRGDQLACRP